MEDADWRCVGAGVAGSPCMERFVDAGVLHLQQPALQRLLVVLYALPDRLADLFRAEEAGGGGELRSAQGDERAR